MNTKSVDSTIDDAKKKATEIGNAVADTAAKVETVGKRGGHRLQEAAARVKHALEQVAVKVVHAGEETAQKAANRAKEWASKPGHHGKERTETTETTQPRKGD